MEFWWGVSARREHRTGWEPITPALLTHPAGLRGLGCGLRNVVSAPAESGSELLRGSEVAFLLKGEAWMTPRWTCALGHRMEAETEEELVRKVQEHMRQDHGMEISRERILRDLREEN